MLSMHNAIGLICVSVIIIEVHVFIIIIIIIIIQIRPHVIFINAANTCFERFIYVSMKLNLLFTLHIMHLLVYGCLDFAHKVET